MKQLEKQLPNDRAGSKYSPVGVIRSAFNLDACVPSELRCRHWAQGGMSHCDAVSGKTTC